MIIPDFYRAKELLEMGITEAMVTESARIINSAFGIEWLQKLQKESLNNNNSVNAISNRHPILDLVTSLELKSVIKLVCLSGFLSNFCNETSISEYISRLKSREQHRQAFFELAVANYIQKTKLKLEGLQILNTEGNPVEVVASDEGTKYWFECKSIEEYRTQEDLGDKMINELRNHLDLLPPGIAIILDISKLKEDVKPKELAHHIGDIVKHIPLALREVGNIEIKDDKWSLTTLRFSPNEALSMYQHCTEGATKLFAISKVKKNSSSSELPDINDMNQPFQKIIAVKTPITESSKEDKIDTLFEKVRRKVRQQRGLLTNKEEVIIVLDDFSIPSQLRAELKVKLIEKYKTHESLSILIAELTLDGINPDQQITFEPIITSNGLSNYINK